MKNIKLYGILAVVIFLIIAVVTVNIQAKKIKALKADNSRIENNNFQLMSDASKFENLYLKNQEVTGKLKRSRDSLAKVLETKPKEIEKIIYLDTYLHDTITKEVPVLWIGKDHWSFTDTINKCAVYKAEAFLLPNDSLKINRTGFDDHNRITEVFYRARPHKFLFIKYGRWVNKELIGATCGSPIERTFQFTK
jgi:hypothetical protein